LSAIKITHIDARTLLREGWRRCYGSELALPVAQCLQAIGWLETNYGMGWTEAIPGAAESNDWGAITAGAEWTGATFEHRDSYPNPSKDPEAVKKEPNIWYTTKFRAYPTPQDGATDLVNIVYLTRMRAVLDAAKRGDTLGFSTALYNTGYYKGFGATPEARVARHHAAVLGAISLQVKALGELPPKGITVEQLAEAERAADELCRVRRQHELWLLTLDVDPSEFGASNIPAELDTADTDPAPPPSEGEPNT
jgi:hypothetical protein